MILWNVSSKSWLATGFSSGAGLPLDSGCLSFQYLFQASTFLAASAGVGVPGAPVFLFASILDCVFGVPLVGNPFQGSAPISLASAALAIASSASHFIPFVLMLHLLLDHQTWT